MAVEPTKVEVLDIQNRVTRLSALRNSHRAAPVPNRPRARRWDRRHTVLDQETLRFYRMGATVAERGRMSMELRCDAILAVVRWPPRRPPPSRGPRPHRRRAPPSRDSCSTSRRGGTRGARTAPRRMQGASDPAQVPAALPHCGAGGRMAPGPQVPHRQEGQVSGGGSRPAGAVVAPKGWRFGGIDAGEDGSGGLWCGAPGGGGRPCPPWAARGRIAPALGGHRGRGRANNAGLDGAWPRSPPSCATAPPPPRRRTTHARRTPQRPCSCAPISPVVG